MKICFIGFAISRCNIERPQQKQTNSFFIVPVVMFILLFVVLFVIYYDKTNNYVFSFQNSTIIFNFKKICFAVAPFAANKNFSLFFFLILCLRAFRKKQLLREHI